jgi:hypothetical protein
MHNLRAERFFKPKMVNGRLLTLEDTVEFFNLVTGVKLNEQEKKALTAFMRAL